jgi:hypothetical protein
VNHDRVSVRDVLEQMNSERARLERLYRVSDRFVTDALEWVSHPATELTDDLTRQIVKAYYASTAFRTVIDDAEAGEVSW